MIPAGFAGHGSHRAGTLCLECERLRAEHYHGAHDAGVTAVPIPVYVEGCPACAETRDDSPGDPVRDFYEQHQYSRQERDDDGRP